MSTQKTYTADIKANTDGRPGQFSALVSVFGNIDLQGDRVMPGAFAESLKSYRDSGDPIPVVFSHEWNDPFKHIGIASPQDVRETDGGLMLKGQLDIEDNPTAKQIHKLMARRSLKEFSFSYDILDEGPGEDKANELRKVHLIEAGPTLKGANPETQLIAVKGMLADPRIAAAVREELDSKAGRTISRATATRLLAARDLLDELLATVEADASSSEDEKDAKTDEPEAKVEEHESVRILREAIAAEEAAEGNH